MAKLYYHTQLETKVLLFTDQLNENFNDNLFQNLKAKVEGNANDTGIVIRVTEMIDHNVGQVNRTDFSGNVTYNIKYNCFICAPVIGLKIVCKVENVIPGLIVARNGPLQIGIMSSKFDESKFKLKEDDLVHLATKKKITINDYVVVNIVNCDIRLGEKYINSLCEIINIASNEEIKMFKNEQKLLEDEEDNASEFI